MDVGYSVRQSMSIVLFIIDNVLSDEDVALDISSVLRVGLGKKWNKVMSPEIDGFLFHKKTLFPLVINVPELLLAFSY